MGSVGCTQSNYFNQVNILNLLNKNVPEGLVQINPKIGQIGLVEMPVSLMAPMKNSNHREVFFMFLEFFPEWLENGVSIFSSDRVW